MGQRCPTHKAMQLLTCEFNSLTVSCFLFLFAWLCFLPVKTFKKCKVCLGIFSKLMKFYEWENTFQANPLGMPRHFVVQIRSVFQQ